MKVFFLFFFFTDFILCKNLPMQILTGDFKVTDIKNLAFQKVPRASLESQTSRIALDYHSDLCNLKLYDNVKIEIFLSSKPSVTRNCYLMRGIIYKIEENRFEASFGGLLMFYEGSLDDNIELESEIYISVYKI